MADMGEALPRLVLGAAVVLSAYFLFEGVTSLLRSDLQTSEPRPAQTRLPSVAPPANEQDPSTHAVPVSKTLDTEREPLWQAPMLPSARPPAPTEDMNHVQQSGPCEADLRIAGAAYVRPSAGDPLVLLSGAGVRKGLRGIGAHVAGKTLVAIYPTAVVLRDSGGRECWVKMSSAHARDVASRERRDNVRAAADRYREEQRQRAIARRKARAAARKKR